MLLESVFFSCETKNWSLYWGLIDEGLFRTLKQGPSWMFVNFLLFFCSFTTPRSLSLCEERKTSRIVHQQRTSVADDMHHFFRSSTLDRQNLKTMIQIVIYHCIRCRLAGLNRWRILIGEREKIRWIGCSESIGNRKGKEKNKMTDHGRRLGCK